MRINRVVAPANAGGKPSVLYTAFYGVAGNQPEAEMKSRLELLTKGMEVKEH